jgi:hypothetical protein
MEAMMLHKVFGLIRLGLIASPYRTNVGRDYFARVVGDPASTGTGVYAPACYLALSPNGAAPDPAATLLPGEIVAGSLVRALAAYAHTNGTATYTLTKTYLSDQTIVILKAGVYTLVSGGTLVYEVLLDAPASTKSGDSVQVTITVTL